MPQFPTSLAVVLLATLIGSLSGCVVQNYTWRHPAGLDEINLAQAESQCNLQIDERLRNEAVRTFNNLQHAQSLQVGSIGVDFGPNQQATHYHRGRELAFKECMTSKGWQRVEVIRQPRYDDLIIPSDMR